MRSKKFIFSILVFSFINFSATAQTATVQDFTRTNRLSGRPAVPDGVIPVAEALRGTICGAAQTNGERATITCMGYNPASSCPSGYYSSWIFGAEGHGFISCVKS